MTTNLTKNTDALGQLGRLRVTGPFVLFVRFLASILWRLRRR
jgi:hypothetical protein